MNEHGITKDNLLTVFPLALQNDKSAPALGDSTAEILARRLGEIDLLRIYTRIDELDEELLDILAYDFKIDWWDPNYTVEEKRKTLKGNWLVHKKLGTKAAVESAISAIYPSVAVTEWFEYGGEPYHFKLEINSTKPHIAPDANQRVLARSMFYKNLRSHLEEIRYIFDPLEREAHVGGKLSAIANVPLPMLEDTFDFLHTERAGGKMSALQNHVLPRVDDRIDFDQTQYIGGRMSSVQHQALPEIKDKISLSSTAYAGGMAGRIVIVPVAAKPDSIAFVHDMRVGGKLANISSIALPIGEEIIVFPHALVCEERAGGNLAVIVEQPLPDIPDKLLLISEAHAGASIESNVILPIPPAPEVYVFDHMERTANAGGTLELIYHRPVGMISDNLHFERKISVGVTMETSPKVSVPVAEEVYRMDEIESIARTGGMAEIVTELPVPESGRLPMISECQVGGKMEHTVIISIPEITT